MKASLAAGRLAFAFLALSPAVSALAWPRWLPELDTLVVRQEETSSDAPAPTPTPDPPKSDDDEDNADGDEGNSDGDEESPETTTRRKPMEPITTNLNTGGLTRSATASGTGNSTSSRPPKKTQFDPMDPPGSVVMVTPAPTDGYQLYKIGDNVKWEWNYTNLQGTPTAIDIYIKCSKVAQPWTLTQNMSFTDPGTYTWDTGEYQKSAVATPLLTEQYTLVIADADGGISATPEPGYLAPFSGFMFGLYQPQPYHDTNDGWQCASCSGAMPGLDNRAVGVAVVMSALTVFSFTWFVVGIGALF